LNLPWNFLGPFSNAAREGHGVKRFFVEQEGSFLGFFLSYAESFELREEFVG